MPQINVPEEFEEIYMEDPDHVEWLKSLNSPSDWDAAAEACFWYKGDEHGFLNWLIEHPDMDCKTATTIFIRMGESLFSTGEEWSHFSQEQLRELVYAVCKRSETRGFSRNAMFTPAEWEETQLAFHNLMKKCNFPSDLPIPYAMFKPPLTQGGNDGVYEMGFGEGELVLKSEMDDFWESKG